MNRELLERPFPPEQIKQREGAFGDVRRSGRPTRYQVGPTTEPYVRISRILCARAHKMREICTSGSMRGQRALPLAYSTLMFSGLV